MAPQSQHARLDLARINHAAFDYYGRLGKVKKFVELHYAEQVTLKTAADVACLEKKYFSTFFHAKIGVRFIDFVSYLRVDHAKQLMRQEDTSISEISALVGFHNRRTFERAFRKWTGTSPSQFRDAVRPC